MEHSLRTGVAYAKAIDASSRSVDAVVSSEAIDRHGDIIDQASWKLDNYLRNPVVLFAHDMEQPIGRAENLQIRDGKLEATIVFAKTPRGDEVLQLFTEKALRAFSVGFRLGRVTAETSPTTGVTIYRLFDNELFEISAVAVPANPDAVAKHKSLGLLPGNYEYDGSRAIVDIANKVASGAADPSFRSYGDASADIVRSALAHADGAADDGDIAAELRRAGL